jgi:dTDP-4-dehydrorhamnose 3,5-epimerase
MITLPCPIPGLIHIKPKVFGDARGFFLETWHRQRYQEVGISEDFVQDNLSMSRKGILRGLHYQKPNSQGKLVQVIQGEVFDVAVDLRQSSPTYKMWHAVILSDENRNQFYIPAGFAHGFLVTSDTALFQYKCTALYSPKDEITLRWDDPEIGIKWPMTTPLVSEKDAKGLLLSQVPTEKQFP